MATAKQEGGLYYVPLGDGEYKAVDAHGHEVEDAPERGPDTPSNQQPGALGAPTPEERMGKAIVDAMRSPPPSRGRGAASSSGEGS